MEGAYFTSRKIVSADAPPHAVAHPIFITLPPAVCVTIHPLSGLQNAVTSSIQRASA